MDTYHLMEDPWLSPQSSLQQYQYEDVSLAWLYTQIRIKIRIKHQLHQNLLLTLYSFPGQTAVLLIKVLWVQLKEFIKTYSFIQKLFLLPLLKNIFDNRLILFFTHTWGKKKSGFKYHNCRDSYRSDKIKSSDSCSNSFPDNLNSAYTGYREPEVKTSPL